MAEPEHFPRNVPFKPSAAFIPWFIINYFLAVALMLACTSVPLLLSGGLDLFTGIAILAGLVLITVVFITWTRLYYDSMFYELHGDELRWRRGVWFRTTGIVP